MEVVKYFLPIFNYHVVAASAHGDNTISPITRVHDDIIFIVEGGRKRV